MSSVSKILTAKRDGLRCSRLFFGLVLLILSGIFTPAEAQFANGYSYRVEVDFVDAEVSGGPHTNFPVLISSTLLDLRTRVPNGGKVENADGYDIIFTSDQAGTTQLAHQIESYNAVTGEIIFWVRAESLAATTKIYMFYGNSSIGTFQGDVTSNGVTGVWDDDYRGVWHMDGLLDSTSNSNDGTNTGTADIAGPIGQARDFSENDQLSMGSGASLDNLSPYTFSVWIDQNDSTSDPARRLFEKRTAGGESKNLYIANDNKLEYVQKTSGTQISRSGPVLSNDTLYHVAVTWDGTLNTSGFLMYVDGVEVSTGGGNGTGTALDDSGGDLWIGSRNDGGRSILGFMDEVRMSSSVRAPQWIETEYNNQSSPAAFYALGPEETNCTPATLPFTDNFTRANSSTVGNCWVEELETGSADAIINSNRLELNSSDEVQAPRISRTFTQVSTGLVKWTYVFNWHRLIEGGYELWMLGGQCDDGRPRDQR